MAGAINGRCPRSRSRIAIAVHVARLQATAKHAAPTAGLTGVSIHRAFYEALEHATPVGGPFAVILFDVQGLKATNDSRGHLTGDALLRWVGQTVRSVVREGDVVAPYCRDEIGVIMLGVAAGPGIAMASAVREALLELSGGGSRRAT